MDYIKRWEPLWLLLLILGALNWAVIAIFNTNVASEIFGTGTLRDVVYCVVGFAGLMMLPRMLEGFSGMADRLHLGGHGAHPRGV
ncbi:MAG TPA: DUF378 domain-containing protein [Solirubrobacteraceae bacterium]|jgi:uncharacterized membrane protein YuzA (DUF378 family)|nr:DUF378 domain-containing protein [Solirubrobacteraceae bacterium]